MTTVGALAMLGAMRRTFAPFYLLAPVLALASSAVADTVERMRDTAIQQEARRRTSGINIKTGEGGIRDIEFIVQFMQLLNGSALTFSQFLPPSVERRCTLCMSRPVMS